MKVAQYWTRIRGIWDELDAELRDTGKLYEKFMELDDK